MIRNRNARRWLSCSAAILLASSPLSWSQVEATPERSPENNAPASPSPEVLHAMGFAMAQNLRLNIEFSPEELDQIFSGMRAFATGESAASDHGALVQEAQTYFFAKLQTAREKEDAQRAILAERNRESAEAYFAELDERGDVEQTESGLYYELVEEGDGDEVTFGKMVVLNYTGTLPDGTVFDKGESAEFPLQPGGGLIAGFTEGLQLINVGGRIKLHIPASLGYGDTPPPGSPIEPGQPLIFEVEVLDLKEAPQAPQMRRPPGPPPGPPPGSLPQRRPGGPPSGPPSGPPPGPPPSMIPPPPPSTTPPPPPSGN